MSQPCPYESRERRSGRSSRIIQAAPPAAVLIAYNARHAGDLQYLAKQLGRGDIRVEAPRWIRDHAQGVLRHVVLDHSVIEMGGHEALEAVASLVYREERLALAFKDRPEVAFDPFSIRFEGRRPHEAVAPHMDRLIHQLGFTRAGFCRIEIQPRQGVALLLPPTDTP